MLSEQDFKYRYSTGRKDLPWDFFHLALTNSTTLDLGLGYFSSACFHVLSIAFAQFISAGGRMRLYINQVLTEEDYRLLKGELSSVQEDDFLISSFYHLKKTFSVRDEHFFRCLSYLIRQNKIEIKIVMPGEGSLAYEKIGIFGDGEGNRILFTGTMNMTACGLLKDRETVECVCSWKSEDNRERIVESEKDFQEIWEGKEASVVLCEADRFCREILTAYPDVEIDELLAEEKRIIKEIASSLNRPIAGMNRKMEKKFPHFPLKYPEGPREYQKEAYRRWRENGKNGIFAMATGTGKTLTALNCAYEEYKLTISKEDPEGYYQILILVPTITLVEQWKEEVRQFDFSNIITVYSQNPNWKKEFVSLKNKLQRGRRESFVVISTYQSFTNEDFQRILLQLPPEGLLLIADEAHNIGSETVKKVFRTLPECKRIGLSATPNRIYDEEGTLEIESFFQDSSPYIYQFSLEKAIDEQFLMEYCYYPFLVFLNEEEMVKYVQYTRLLMNYYDSTTGRFRNEVQAKKYLMLRKQVLHKAENKIDVLEKIVKEIILHQHRELKYCFVYVPEGKENTGDEGLFYRDEAGEKIIQKMLKKIRELVPATKCNVYTGDMDKQNRKVVLEGFEKGDIDVLLAMKCLDEGVDVPRAEIGIFASSSGNPRQFIQRRGRLLRRHPDKKFAYLYDMVVVPDFRSPHYSREFYSMERSLVRGELSRVAYFASLAINMNFALQNLRELTRFYQLSLSELILNVNQ